MTIIIMMIVIEDMMAKENNIIIMTKDERKNNEIFNIILGDDNNKNLSPIDIVNDLVIYDAWKKWISITTNFVFIFRLKRKESYVCSMEYL